MTSLLKKSFPDYQAESKCFDLIGIPAELLSSVLDSLLQQGKDSDYVKVYAMGHKCNMEESARAMHIRKFELSIARKGNKKDK